MLSKEICKKCLGAYWNIKIYLDSCFNFPTWWWCLHYDFGEVVSVAVSENSEIPNGCPFQLEHLLETQDAN